MVMASCSLSHFLFACISCCFFIIILFLLTSKISNIQFQRFFLAELSQSILCRHLFPPLVSFSLSLSVPNINLSHKATNLLSTYKYIANVGSEHKEPLAVGHWFQIYSSSHRKVKSCKVKSSRQAPCSFHARQNVGVNLNTLRFLLNSLMFINISKSLSLVFDLTLIISCQQTSDSISLFFQQWHF